MGHDDSLLRAQLDLLQQELRITQAERDEWKRGAEASYAGHDATMAELQRVEAERDRLREPRCDNRDCNSCEYLPDLDEALSASPPEQETCPTCRSSGRKFRQGVCAWERENADPWHSAPTEQAAKRGDIDLPHGEEF